LVLNYSNHAQIILDLLIVHNIKKIDAIFRLVELQFHRLSTSHSASQSSLAARALWSGVHGICTLSLTGKMNLLGSDTVEESVVVLVENFIKGWKT
jgi:hypothetical protein